MLIEHYKKDPRKITEDEVQEYFLFRRNTSKWSPSTLRICYSTLPTGFMKVRYYGFMSPNASVSLDDIRGLIELAEGFENSTPTPEPGEPLFLYCPSCGGKLEYICSVLPFELPPWARTRNAVFENILSRSG